MIRITSKEEEKVGRGGGKPFINENMLRETEVLNLMMSFRAICNNFFPPVFIQEMFGLFCQTRRIL